MAMLGGPEAKSKLGWHMVEMRDSVQVFPSWEHGHTLGLSCACGPAIGTEPKPIVTHRDELTREGPEDPG